MQGKLHKKLQLLAINWLRTEKECTLYADEVGVHQRMRKHKSFLRICDVIGLNEKGQSFCIEIKTGRDDLRKGRQAKTTSGKEIKFTYYYLLLAPNLQSPARANGNWRNWGILQAIQSKKTILPLCTKEAKKVKGGRRYNGELKRAILMKLVRKNYERLQKDCGKIK